MSGPRSLWRRLLGASDIETLRLIAEGKVTHETCSLCRDIACPYTIVEKAYDTVNPFRDHLVGQYSFKRCPVSGAAYWQSETYEYLAGGSEDTYTFGRVTPEYASDVLAKWAAEEPPGGKAQA